MDDTQRTQFVLAVSPFIPHLKTLIQQVIEKYLSYVARTSPNIYELSFEDDPPWDSSGELKETGKRLSEKSDFTLKEITQMYTGQEEATYCSGYGTGYPTYSEDCERLAFSCLFEFAKAFIKQCLEKGRFSDYLTDVLDDENEYDNISDFATDFACDELEFWEEDKGNLAFSTEDLFDGKFGEQKIRQVYSRYELELARFFRSEREYDQKYNSFEENARKKVQQIMLPKKIHRKLERTSLDKEIRKELESLYSKEDLALLFHFRQEYSCNSYVQEYDIMRTNACGERPFFDNFLEDFVTKYVEDMLEKETEN